MMKILAKPASNSSSKFVCLRNKCWHQENDLFYFETKIYFVFQSEGLIFSITIGGFITALKNFWHLVRG